MTDTGRHARGHLFHAGGHLSHAGMRAGVRASDVFVLVLSEHVLGSWFCQQVCHLCIEQLRRPPLHNITSEPTPPPVGPSTGSRSYLLCKVLGSWSCH